MTCHKERKLGLLGKKLGMTRFFAEDGTSIGVTVIELGPCLVLNKRSKAKGENGRSDGYSALRLGFAQKLERKVSKTEEGTLKKVGGKEKARSYIREMRVDDATAGKFEVGQEITIKDAEFKTGEYVDITGTSKGAGFQGVFARYNFSGSNASHGSHEYFRHGGSIGNRKWPGRVMKGRKMPGHQGNKKITTQNVKLVAIREEDNVILLRGSVPGPKNGYVIVRPAIKG
ncbi:MAG: 50S ribosomal protein L3 [Deltaproteobacteria bacterium]|nr:50S ribosomal protein L3 [Deltaproteobacteria bacterium]